MSGGMMMSGRRLEAMGMDEAEYEQLRQEWSEVHRPQYSDFTWSAEQLEVRRLVEERERGSPPST